MRISFQVKHYIPHLTNCKYVCVRFFHLLVCLHATLHLQGIPGAYSETAALEAYPNCETVPCEHFETAFQVLILKYSYPHKKYVAFTMF